MKVEREAMREFRKYLDRHSTPGLVHIVCPECRRTVRTVAVKVDGLNRYAFRSEGDTLVSTELNGRGCCF